MREGDVPKPAFDILPQDILVADAVGDDFKIIVS